MATKKYWIYAASALVLVASVGCAGGVHDKVTATREGSQLNAASIRPGGAKLPAKARPPQEPCVFPSASSDIAPILTFSRLVVKGTITAAPTVTKTTTGEIVTRVPLANVTQFAGQGVAPPSSLVIVETGDGRTLLSTPGTYVLFLDNSTLSDPVTESPGYFIVNGMRGMFAVTNSGVSLHCANYQDPDSPILAKGSGVSLSSFQMLVGNAHPLVIPTKSHV